MPKVGVDRFYGRGGEAGKIPLPEFVSLFLKSSSCALTDVFFCCCCLFFSFWQVSRLSNCFRDPYTPLMIEIQRILDGCSPRFTAAECCMCIQLAVNQPSQALKLYSGLQTALTHHIENKVGGLLFSSHCWMIDCLTYALLVAD